MQIKLIDTSVQENFELVNRLQKETLPYDTLYNCREGWWWVAYENNRPCGFAGLVCSSRWTDCGYLCRSGVIREFRGRGLQKRLIRAREKMARRVGFNWLITDTTDNPPSSNSLIALQYRLFNPTIPWAGKHSLYWRKKL